MKKFFDVLGGILAVVLVLVFVVLLINANFPFIPANSWIMMVLDVLRNYGALALIGIVGLEAISKWHWIFKILFLLCLALIVIFLFFPGTYANLIGMIKQ